MWHEWSTLERLIWLKRRIGGGASWVWRTITGAAPLTLANAIHHAIQSLTQYGLCTQSTTPTPDAPVDIVCNNGVLKYSANMANVNEQTALPGYYISAQGVVTADTNNWMYQAFIPCKPNTAYTLSFSQSVYYVTISEYSTAADSGFIVRKNGAAGSNTSLTITTGANTNFIRFGANINRVVVSLEMVLDINWMLNLGGTAMDYQPYVEGGIYTEGTPEVLTVRGKNLYNPADFTSINNAYLDDDGVERPFNGTAYTKMYIPVKPNTRYTLSGSFDGGSAAYGTAIYFFDSDKHFISRVSATGTVMPYPRTYTTPSNCYFVDFQFRTNSDRSKWQLELGSTATDYEPYVTPQTASVPMLLGLGDAVRDEVELVNGPKTVRVGVYAVTGGEAWIKYNGVFSCNDAILPAALDVACMCTRYAGVRGSTAIASMQNGQIKTGTTSYARRLFIRDDSCETEDDLKAKLSAMYAAGEPPILTYPLATATTEQGTPHALHTSAGTNVVDVTANVSPVELEVEYASNN